MLDGQLRLTRALLLVATAYNFDFDRDGEYGFLDDDATDPVVIQGLQPAVERRLGHRNKAHLGKPHRGNGLPEFGESAGLADGTRISAAP